VIVIKIISVIGTRPQFIKYAIISNELRKNNHEILIHTGQHYNFEMSKLFFNQLQIPKPDYNLGIGSASYGLQIGNMMQKLEKIFLKEKPDAVLLYGDTNSTLAGSLASRRFKILIGHIEAGLRSFDRTMPEEINRVITDHISNFLFAPTKTAVNNLKDEGITKNVFLVGDVMYDILRKNMKIAKKSNILKNLDIKPKEYFLTTIHRISNTENILNLSNILEALSSSNKKIVFPIHPRTERFLKKYGLSKKIGKNICMIKPVGYFDFIWLEKNAKKILTDSGGIQKEAYLLNVPCITLRENSEWVETIQDGWNILVGAHKEKIVDAMGKFEPSGKQSEHFGKGDSAKKIVNILDKYTVR